MDVLSYRGDQPHAFISYAHRDSDRVLPILEQMHQDGYRFWYDEGIDPGAEWAENIAEHVASCTYFIAFLSGNYLSSSNCKDELEYARDKEKKILLIHLEPIEMPEGMKMRLNRLQYISKYSYANEQDFYEKLYEAKNIAIISDKTVVPSDDTEDAGDTVVKKKSVAPPSTALKAMVLFLLVTLCVLFLWNRSAASKYKKADSYLQTGNYMAAVELFEELGDYKDSEEKINKAKYQYVCLFENNESRTVYSYLKDLVKQDYKDSAEIYESLYRWEAIVYAINSDPYDLVTDKQAFSANKEIYFHFMVLGGIPDESIRVTIETIFPNGEVDEYVAEETLKDGDEAYYAVIPYDEGLIMENGRYLRCNFYDEQGNLIGAADVNVFPDSETAP